MFNAPPMKTSRETLQIMSDHYPERLGFCLLVDAPWLFSGMFKVFFLAVLPHNFRPRRCHLSLTKKRRRKFISCRMWKKDKLCWTSWLLPKIWNSGLEDEIPTNTITRRDGDSKLRLILSPFILDDKLWFSKNFPIFACGRLEILIFLVGLRGVPAPGPVWRVRLGVGSPHGCGAWVALAWRVGCGLGAWAWACGVGCAWRMGCGLGAWGVGEFLAFATWAFVVAWAVLVVWLALDASF